MRDLEFHSTCFVLLHYNHEVQNLQQYCSIQRYFFGGISSKTNLASSMLPHLLYMSVKVHGTNTFSLTPIFKVQECNCYSRESRFKSGQPMRGHSYARIERAIRSQVAIELLQLMS
ncbi:hypothetical protein Pfo_011687 [Paulownia fortunei]|nr:hypothetical protein Pfo_011687 [Paulownia fortunei]